MAAAAPGASGGHVTAPTAPTASARPAAEHPAPKPAPLQPGNKVFAAAVASRSEVLWGVWVLVFFFSVLFFFFRVKIAEHLGIGGLFRCSQAGLAVVINVKPTVVRGATEWVVGM